MQLFIVQFVVQISLRKMQNMIFARLSALSRGVGLQIISSEVVCLMPSAQTRSIHCIVLDFNQISRQQTSLFIPPLVLTVSLLLLVSHGESQWPQERDC